MVRRPWSLLLFLGSKGFNCLLVHLDSILKRSDIGNLNVCDASTLLVGCPGMHSRNTNVPVLLICMLERGINTKYRVLDTQCIAALSRLCISVYLPINPVQTSYRQAYLAPRTSKIAAWLNRYNWRWSYKTVVAMHWVRSDWGLERWVGYWVKQANLTS